MISGFALTLGNRRGKFRINRSFWLMTVVSLIISLEIVIYKYLLGTVSWSTGTIGGGIAGAAVSLLLLAVPSVRRDIVSGAGAFFRASWVFIAGALFTMGGLGSYLFASATNPVTLITGVAAVQPFIVFLLALVLGPFFPQFFKEKIDGRTIIKKLFLFALTAVGMYLIAG
jgi:hypothetical protein